MNKRETIDQEVLEQATKTDNEILALGNQFTDLILQKIGIGERSDDPDTVHSFSSIDILACILALDHNNRKIGGIIKYVMNSNQKSWKEELKTVIPIMEKTIDMYKELLHEELLRDITE